MQCNAPNCGNASTHTSQEITYHMFPTESSLRAAWLQALQLTGWEPEGCSAVCSNHFQREDLLVGSSGLRAGAVPVAVRVTLELNQPINEVYGPFDSNQTIDSAMYSLLEEIAEDYINSENDIMFDPAIINDEFISNDKIKYTSRLLEDVEGSVEDDNYDVMERELSNIEHRTEAVSGCIRENVAEVDIRTQNDIVSNQKITNAQHASNHKFKCISDWPEDIAENGKTELCDALGQGITEFEDTSNISMAYLSSWEESIIENHIRAENEFVPHQDIFNEDTCNIFKCTSDLQEHTVENTKTENSNVLNQDNVNLENSSSVSMVCISAMHENIAQDDIRTLNDIVTLQENFNCQVTSDVNFECISNLPEDTGENSKIENCNTIIQDIVQFEDTSGISMVDISSLLDDIVENDIRTQHIFSQQNIFDVEETCNANFKCISNLQDIVKCGKTENRNEMNQNIVELEDTTNVGVLCTSSLDENIIEDEIRTQNNVNFPEDTAENDKTENCNTIGQKIDHFDDTSNFSMVYIPSLDENVVGDDIKTQNNIVINQDIFNAQATMNAGFDCMSNFPENTSEICKPENCNAISQNIEFQDASSVNMVYISSFDENIVDKNITTDIVHQNIVNADDTCDSTKFKCTSNLQEDTGENSKVENYNALFGDTSSASMVCVSGLDGNIVDDVKIGNDVIYNDCVKVDHTTHNHMENTAGEGAALDTSVRLAEARRNTELNTTGIHEVTPVTTEFTQDQDTLPDSETDRHLVNNATSPEVYPYPTDCELLSLNQIDDGAFIETCSQSDCSINHSKSHSSKGPLLCEICNKSFTKMSNLRKHILVHSVQKPYVCDICDKSFIQKSILKSHIGTHYELNPYKCHICDKTYNYKSSFAIHMRRHSSETPFTCNICNKTFNRKTILDTHMRTHSGEKPFSCRMCDKTFSQKPHLNAHMRTHSGEKPFSCDVCYKAFNRKSHLTRHIKIHSGDKPFSCKICFKEYGDTVKLSSHMRTHDKRPYSCGSCYKVFDSRPHLNRHLRRYI